MSEVRFGSKMFDNIDDIIGVGIGEGRDRGQFRYSVDEPEDEIPSENITVKFKVSETQIIAHSYSIRMTIDEVKTDIASKFKIDSKHLLIIHADTVIPNEVKLFEICKNNFGIIDIKLALTNEATKNNIQLDVNVYYSHYTLPDIITVQIAAEDSSDGQPKELLVEIMNKTIVKPFVGGYVNRKTNLEYHDAFTQTGPILERIKFNDIQSRDTQTVDMKTIANDTNYERATQAFGSANELLYISSGSDYSIQPRPYESYEEMTNRLARLEKVRLIQKNFRAYMIRKMIKARAKEYRQLLEEQKRREHMIEEIYVNRYKKECVIKTYPKTKDDFDMLYSQIQQWKETEIKRISELHTGGPKIAALNGLLDNEITLLNVIEKQRSILREKAIEAKNDKALKKLGKPKKWIGYNNKIVEMDTLRTQHVRFMTDYYNKLKCSHEKEQRLLLIEEIEKILEIQNNRYAHELKELFDKERHLIKCNLSIKELEPLRQRQLTRLLEIIKDEENYKTEKLPTRICDKCKKVRPLEKFALQTRQSVVNVCKNCSQLKISAIDKSVYLSILRAIRRDERKRGALASYAFVIQEDDLRHIIENIWHGHSILSQADNRTNLRLPRWEIGDDWAPWNCICLTESETRAHVKIKSLENVYEKKMIEDIRSKNLLAKAAFKKLTSVDHEFVQSGDWWSIGMDGKTL